VTGWDDGYIHDIAYSSGFYPELSPVWLATAATLLGHRPPDITRPFRWAELGCGFGLPATVFAATNPHAEFWGFDFNPAHIEGARRTAGRAGIGNIRFDETAFAELAEARDGALPQFDFIVAHGVWTWVSPEVQAQIVRFVRRFLAPGGLLYLSYNTLAGWAAMLPLQRFMRDWARAFPGPSATIAPAAAGFLAELAQAGAGYFVQNPNAAARIKAAAGFEARNLAHDYFNDNWLPTTFGAVADAMAEAKCGHIGSATLVDNIDAVTLPPHVVRLLGGVADPRLKEFIRDLGANRTFRRDIFRRGTDQPPPGEQRATLEALLLTGLGREHEAELVVPTGTGHLTLHSDTYRPLLERLAAGLLSVGELQQMPALAGKPLAEATRVASYLIGGRFAHPVPAVTPSAAAIAAAAAVNAEIARQNADGASLGALAAPLLGSGLNADAIETAVAAGVAAGTRDAASLAERALATLAASGRAVMHDGAAVTDPAAAAAAMGVTVHRFLAERLPLLVRLGVIPT
jgi:SAM-dependent methyltransferase